MSFYEKNYVSGGIIGRCVVAVLKKICVRPACQRGNQRGNARVAAMAEMAARAWRGAVLRAIACLTSRRAGDLFQAQYA
jgi:hypothetical protein